jgi:hypothetical protein
MTVYALLWSHKNTKLDLKPVDSVLRDNRDAFRKNEAGDQRILMVGSHEELSKAMLNAQFEMENREAKNAKHKRSESRC